MQNNMYEILTSDHFRQSRGRGSTWQFCVSEVEQMSGVHRLERRARGTAQIIHVVGGSREREGWSRVPWSFWSNSLCFLHDGPACCGLSLRDEAT